MADERKSFSERLAHEKREADISSIPQLRDELILLTSKIDDLQHRYDELDSALKSKRKKDAREKLLYIIPLLLAVAFTAFLVSRGWAETPTVAIEYNVGEIIGGLLVGLAALVAGLAYAFRRGG